MSLFIFEPGSCPAARAKLPENFHFKVNSPGRGRLKLGIIAKPVNRMKMQEKPHVFF
jgi:hypothetical protein